MKIVRWGLVASGALLLACAQADDVTQEATETQGIDQELLKQVQEISKQALLVETFEESETFDGTRWVKSTHEKYASQAVTLDEYTVRTGHLEADKGLVLDAPAKHYGLAVKLDSPLQVDGSDGKKELVVQYELKLQKGLNCGGAYVKLLRKNESNDYTSFDNDTPFVIMFGPDKCGANDKVHFIFQHKNPLTGKYEEKHLNGPPQIKSDRLTHLYTLVVRDDNTYEMFIDQKSVSKGSLLENFTPSVLPPKEIDDADDKKPSDWVDEAKIRDPSATKPDDWDEDAPARIPDEEASKPEDWLDDESALIDDPSVAKPEDWDDEDDGEWVAPQIPNPKCEAISGCGEWVRPTKANPAYKGKWQAPLIDNPEYKGEWKPRTIPNPDYFEDEHPARLDPIGALAVEVWTMSEGITFDNFWLGNDLQKAEEFATLTFAPKHKLEAEEQEKQRARDRKELEEKRAKDGSFFHQITSMATGFVEFAKENPVAGIGSALAVTVLTVLIAFFACCGKSKDSELEKEELEDVANKTKVKDSGSEGESEDKPKLRHRKKAPVVKDD
ncbi:hypothetical protein Poli38472_008467 [Pythium oligandrum]|uniref:Calnexin n=1 Tax=Pythium oligandrum TaxID=41045 RepID=A0A8K1C3L9_PYTOL|nr:hypothetical protein Poli38472_008467 [Pythium oligandrum]|eukprot:TMW55819.1 hypothetical protein Poli38472_008467 [Pythium oligandrum]